MSSHPGNSHVYDVPKNKKTACQNIRTEDNLRQQQQQQQQI